MADQQMIATTNLLLDHENPRLAGIQQSQTETIHAMLRAEGPTTLALAESIAHEGVSPMERLIVMPSEEDDKRFIVLEGNRRVTAIKLLAEPALAEAAISAGKQKKLATWSGDYHKRGIISEMECVVFTTREEANPWIERRHRGNQGGLGIVRWGATEAARFDARRSGKYSPELQVLDYVAQYATLDDETRDKLHNVSITNLERLISDKAVRDALGLEIGDDGWVQSRYPEKETLKPLIRIIGDLAHDKIVVGDIYNAKERQNWTYPFFCV